MILLRNIKIYSENTTYDSGYIKIKNGKIIEIGENNKLIDVENYVEVPLPANYSVIPGMIDIHIHGADGADTMDGTSMALDTISCALIKEGTTSFLATTMTQELPLIEGAIENVADYITLGPKEGHAEVLGIHLEGPFINKDMAGAQPIHHIIDPDVSLFKYWQERCRGAIKLVTVAPEAEGGLELIRYLDGNGVVVSIGHSNATYEEIDKAINAGAKQVTHLFNQMSGLHHRKPGIVGAAFLRDELRAEMIVDGVHVRPEIVKIAFQQITDQRLILITDAMRAKCMKNGVYDLGGQEVSVADGKATLKDGTLAGSVLKMGNAFKNILGFTGCTIESAIKMASENPAKQLGLFDRLGSISNGKDADIVILDENLDVFMTICKGKIAFKKGENNI